MLSGQYATRHGAWNVGVNTGDDVTFVSHRLADAGYQTRLIGKAETAVRIGVKRTALQTIAPSGRVVRPSENAPLAPSPQAISR